MITQRSASKALSTPAMQSIGCSVDCVLRKQRGRLSRDRDYRVYLPAGYDPAQSYPLLVVLHGCRQNHLSMQEISGFDAIADRESFIVVYPFITRYEGSRIRNCWGWWLPRQRQRGSGEVADLARLARQVSADYRILDGSVHICGLSSGAAMSIACLATYSDVWASGASVAGVPYGESGRSVRISRFLPVKYKRIGTLTRLLQHALFDCAPPLLIVQSSADQVVDARLADHIRQTWLNVSDCVDGSSGKSAGDVQGVHWEMRQYFKRSGYLQLASFVCDKISHGWSGGLPGAYSETAGPNVSELIWSFCSSTASRYAAKSCPT